MNIKCYFKKILTGLLLDLDTCSESDLARILHSVESEKYGFIKVSNYVNVEGAMKFLGLTSRSIFFKLLKEYNIKSYKINNHPIGYHKKEIEELYEKEFKVEKVFKE